MKRILLALAFIGALSSAAFGIDQPYVWPQTVGTTASQVLPSNTARKQVFFHNPNATATVAVCPVVSRKDGTNVACAVNGAGSLTLVPGGSILITGVGGNPALPSAWNGVASSPSSALTIYEFE